ncbi:hypothetical protein ACLH9T_004871, partial [Salmonella enterica]
GDLTILSAFSITVQQDPCRQINFLCAQQAGFRATQTAGVDSPEQDRHDQMPKRRYQIIVDSLYPKRSNSQSRSEINADKVTITAISQSQAPRYAGPGEQHHP